MNIDQVRLRKNVEEVQARIEEAASRASRSSNDVAMVAVTKYVGVEATHAALTAGCAILGESRPQPLWEKAAALEDQRPRWHLIGHLQRNKVDKTIRHCELIHSVDSLRLLDAIEEASAKQNRVTEILLEANVSGDESKHGWGVEGMPKALDRAVEKPHIRVRGVMTMAARSGGLESARVNFQTLRVLFDDLKKNAPDCFTEISMGMSGDFEVAIEEGATLVRVGSALWKGVVEGR